MARRMLVAAAALAAVLSGCASGDDSSPSASSSTVPAVQSTATAAASPTTLTTQATTTTATTTASTTTFTTSTTTSTTTTTTLPPVPCGVEGGRVAYTERLPTDSGSTYSEIFTMNPDGSDRRRFTFDGGTYVKTVQGEEDETYDVHTASFSPTWSLEGTRLGFLFHTPDDSFEVRTADADGQDMQVLFNDWTASMLSWSPDGTEIAYGDDRGLWVANADGSSPRLIAQPSPDIPPMGGPGTVEVVSWSPDGSAIAFAEWARCGCGGGSAFVNIIDVDGGNLRHDVCNQAYTDTLDWTPDGATLLCDGDGLLSVQADGTGLTRLAEDAGTPALSPSGSQVLFIGRQGGDDRGLWCYDMATATSSLVLSPFTFSHDLAW